MNIKQNSPNSSWSIFKQYLIVQNYISNEIGLAISYEEKSVLGVHLYG